MMEKNKKKVSNHIYFSYITILVLNCNLQPVIEWETDGTEHSPVCPIRSQIELPAVRRRHSGRSFTPLGK